MEANELMIGDWVCYSEPNNYYTKVKEIRCTSDGEEYYIRCHRDSKDTFLEQLKYEDFSVDILHPILLTPEILEKNGFIEDVDKDDRLADMYHLFVPTGFERESFTIQVGLYREPTCGVSTVVQCWGWLPPYNGGLNDIHLCNANYVHQLQHALRLCGIEKDIVL